ncbi:hypothetical protein [Nocardioides sp. TF02-7]|uniref:hypothetical protein n=1 Tax=Nocardioides sp. TF02-7 TaxID=2917724 RepID=UPI001F059DAA|nr:hypothetical protein [Nocardioides sp. TF02-7]UMG91734.1 hypothetical protein MF408_16920 [Nocardioides sp. TF02-7]
MKLDRTDVLVAAVTVATLFAAVGMAFDVWQAVYYSIPAFVLLFMLLGSMSSREEWSSAVLVPVVGFWAVLTALFVAGAVLMDSSRELGGLHVSSGIFLYLIWPLGTIGAPLVYALVHHRWLAPDLAAADEEARS